MPENPASYRVVRTKSYLFNKAVSSIRTFMKKTEPACASLTPSPMPFIIFSAW
uniref:Uncharacterized protein n=1 Tax=Klebsiella pneumoniae TaxID=573 RepID=A0A6G9HT11_KLEPN|nr:hypothetical protein [Klebsiella pneumoniae]